MLTPKEKAKVQEAFEILARETLAINEANGWKVTTPEDWVSRPEMSAAVAPMLDGDAVLPGDIRTLKGWNIGCMMMVAVSYISRALEAMRKGDYERFRSNLFSARFAIDRPRNIGKDDPQWIENGEVFWANNPNLTPEVIKTWRLSCIIMLQVSELGEAMDAVAKHDQANFIEEQADAFIRTIDLTGGLKMDLATAVMDKLEANAKRGFRHGNKIV